MDPPDPVLEQLSPLGTVKMSPAQTETSLSGGGEKLKLDGSRLPNLESLERRYPFALFIWSQIFELINWLAPWVLVLRH